MPKPELLYTFPFINDAGSAGAGDNPMLVLNSMLVPANNNPAYVSTKQGAAWFCAVSSHDLLIVLNIDGLILT